MAGELMEVILYVRDMEAQVSFYRDVLGIRVKEPAAVQDFGEVCWVELDTGSSTLALHSGGKSRFGTDAPKVVFRVPDVAASRARLVQDGVLMGTFALLEPAFTSVMDGTLKATSSPSNLAERCRQGCGHYERRPCTTAGPTAGIRPRERGCGQHGPVSS